MRVGARVMVRVKDKSRVRVRVRVHGLAPRRNQRRLRRIHRSRGSFQPLNERTTIPGKQQQFELIEGMGGGD